MCVLCRLQNLYEGLGEHSQPAFDIYYYIVKLAGQVDAVPSVYTDIAKLMGCGCAAQGLVPRQGCLHGEDPEAAAAAPRGPAGEQDEVGPVVLPNVWLCLTDLVGGSDQASKVMVELLSTYTEDNASQARDDAHRCIVTCLADPNTFLMDHLLNLKPVRFLEGELIHDLLTIFVTGRLEAYHNFYSSNADFVASLGLSHDQCLHKMRLLTFMQMAETCREIPFSDLQTELRLPAKDIEGFVIDALRTKMVQAKIDQMQGKVLIGSTMHRTFGRAQWLQLREFLALWYKNMSTVESSMQTVLTSAMDHHKLPL
ncbi:EIF3M [Cordylochernes scorpioides]|uniref:EIF3M n=1 Tax=Cordylochernes scorpioides TaxID=51811 RepID=A0ABY6L739_9ARAC|nr:EIF3M [Cordylochernes scorpioides]